LKKIALLIMPLLLAACHTAPAARATSDPTGCHYRGSGLYVLPDAQCTPGVTNPVVTADAPHYKHTICKAGWTATVRPSASDSDKLKSRAMKMYGLPLSAKPKYELDHLIPLEVGGAPADIRNLWPEPNYPHGGSGFVHNPKDATESDLRRAVCAGRMSLTDAQRIETTDWTTAP
jgi:hypothetical protein